MCFSPPHPFRLEATGDIATEALRLLEEAAYGVTRIYLRCIECGDVKTELVLGRYQPSECAEPSATEQSPRAFRERGGE